MIANDPPTTRPHLGLRIGITGARSLRADQIERIDRQINALFAMVAKELAALQHDAGVRETYAAGSLELVFLSPLARGADRLAAQAALAHGYALHVPTPFPLPVYETDFKGAEEPYEPSLSVAEDLAAFRALLGRAAGTFALDGGRGIDEDHSYRAVGRHVAHNCDLLIALWNGERAKSPGGTGDIVRFAAHIGLPVWWIHATDPAAAPALIRRLADLRRPDLAASGEAADSALAVLLERSIRPPSCQASPSATWLRRLAHRARAWLLHGADPLAAYLTEGEPKDRAIWHCYGRFLQAIAPRQPGELRAMLPAEGEVETWWERLYAPADRLSLAYGDRYRSSYVLIFAMAALALACAALGLAANVATAVAATALELVLLCGIGALVLGNELFRWHERWIAYRLLAELFRKQRVLATVGWSLPAWGLEDICSHEAERDAWVAWYFVAALRAAPLPRGEASPILLTRAAEVGGSLIDEQADYHRDREDRYHRAAHWLGRRGEWFFLATLVLVLGKLWLLLGSEAHAPAVLVGLLAAVLPALSAAFVGIQAYAEFDLLRRQSVRMRRVMHAARTELDAIVLKCPLASQALGGLFDGVAQAMLQDVQGWSLLFGTKVLETG
jgi:hypothetical protein